MVGEKPYLSGTACSSCPASKPTCVDGLCSAANCGGRTCQNGGILVTDVCMCDCRKTGFEGDLCEISTASITTAASAIVLASVLCSVSAYFTLV
ncbi:cysteine-rich venom protein Mr30-like [Gigantopelta aegis]|uniref:cysteine-rich venom protein Mr30-like n=1 Tax=Gigantopelta aegis TaxID=1735272 RepID=UPI001B88DF70|nr:cysteine-rich venom protein Mr30-like [Gigantopelta aegis]